MEKTYAAIGGFAGDGGATVDVPATDKEMCDKVEEIMASCPMGTVLTGEQVAILRTYLTEIGCDEVSQDYDGSLQGKGSVSIGAEGCGISVEARGDLEVESRWHAERKQWTGDMHVTRMGGDKVVKELAFDFYYFSIGQDAKGQFIVLYNEHYDRTFIDPYHLADFNGGGTAQASRLDISKHIQWGFYMHVKCSILTAEGTLVL